MQNKQISILGTGSWAIGLANLISNNIQQPINLWNYNADKFEKIISTGYFPHPKNLIKYSKDKYNLTDNIHSIIQNSDFIISATPSEATPSIIDLFRQSSHINQLLLNKTIFISATKGLNPVTGQTMSQTWSNIFEQDKIVALSGPNLAAEAANDLPMRTVLSGSHRPTLDISAELFANNKFKITYNTDPMGIELCGTLKNVIAILAGASDGLNLGTSGKGCILTRGAQDIINVIKQYNGNEETFFTVGGLGDMIITASSELSRNYRTGYYLAQKKSLNEIYDLLGGQVAEGIHTAPLIIKYGINFPMANIVMNMLKDNSYNIEQALIDII